MSRTFKAVFISLFVKWIRLFWTLSNKHMCLKYFTCVDLDNEFSSGVFD